IGVHKAVVVCVVALGCRAGGRGADDDSIVEVQSALTTTYEAETMTHSTGGAVTDGWNIWSNGFISTNHPFVAGSNTITVTAQGQLASGIGPHMVVSVGGVAIGNTTVTATAWTPFPFTFTAAAGTQEIRVTFDNDECCTNGDRNLLVDKVVVTDNATPPPDA